MGLRRGGRALLNLTAAHIAELVEEIAPLARGASVIDVRGLPPRDLLLVLEDTQAVRASPAAEHPSPAAAPPKPARKPHLTLRFSADTAAPRFHVQIEKSERHAGPLGPFFQRVQRDLTGCRLRAVSHVAGDRIVRLDFADTPSGQSRALVCELFGARANLVLLGPDDVILEVLVPPSSKATSHPPRLVPEARWAAPARAQARAQEPTALATIAESFPAPPLASHNAELALRAPRSWTVESVLGTQAVRTQRASAQKKLVERLERKLSRARAKLAGLETRVDQSAQAERIRRDGELLKANLHLARRGLTEVEVADVFELDAPARKIALDPKQSPVENLHGIFERAKKLEHGRAAAVTECEMARARIDELEVMLARARDAESDPAELASEATSTGMLEPEQQGDPRKRKAPPPRLPYRTFTTERGAEIRVGRNSRDNDDLTFHHARGNDVWMHSADSPGSHVVLRLEKAAEPHPEDVLDAAHLALHFSPMRASAKGDVHVARRKEVHKPRGAKPGLVTLSGGRIMRIRSQPERLERLLRSGRASNEPPDSVS